MFNKTKKVVYYSSKENIETRGKIRFAVAESYKTIRTNLLFMLAQNKGKVIAVSSSVAGEGKSTTAVNLAITFSQLGGRVILIDGDLRKSSVHRKLKIDNKDGLSNLIAGFSNLSDVVKSVSGSLDVLTAGPTPPNPAEMLGTKAFADLIAECRQNYDYIIIDTPPINIVTDALIVSPLTDGLVMVVRDGITKHSVLKKSVEAIKFANIKILGVIMNAEKTSSMKKHYYNDYKY